MRPAFLLLSTFMALATIASAQSQPVLRAQSTYASYNGSFQLYDSMTHYHNNGRNSIILYPPPSRFYPTDGIYQADTTIHDLLWNGESFRYRYEYNAAGLVTEYVKENISAASPEIEEKHIFSYTAAMQPDTITTMSIWADTRRTIHFYNGANLTGKLVHDWNKATKIWIPYYRDFYSYNNGKLIEIKADLWDAASSSWTFHRVDSFMVSGPGSDSTYVFRQVNNSSLINQKHKFKRDLNNRILLDSIYDQDTFAYARYYQYNAQGKLLLDSTAGIVSSYRYNVQSDLTSIYKTMKGNGVIIWRGIDSFTYNSTKQLTRRIEFDSSSYSNGWKLSTGIKNYFYDAPVSVPEVTAESSLQLYPIPATSYINLAMQFTKPQAFSVRIFDMQGRLVSNWQEPAQKDYCKQIPLTGMAPGQYTLHIWAGEESCSKQFMLVR